MTSRFAAPLAAELALRSKPVRIAVSVIGQYTGSLSAGKWLFSAGAIGGMTNVAKPLAGVRVLDLSRVLAGPFCTQLLADLGADVVKVERPPLGDDTRQWGPPFLPDDGPSAYYVSCNRGKRSLALDLARPEARAVLDDLVRAADVLVENFLPQSLGQARTDCRAIRRAQPAARPGLDLRLWTDGSHGGDTGL